MNRLFDAAHEGQLAQLAWSRVLLAFDFDGTLAPIVADRDRARLRDRTRVLLEQVCRRYPCIILSGRSRADVERRVEGIPFRHIIGNHGLEPWEHIRELEPQIATIRPQLVAALAAHSGIEIEDKRYSLALHYRKSRRKRDVRLAIHRAVQELSLPMRLVPGKLVVNVIPEHAPHKGDALVRLRAQEGADTALYVGDDVTDEDVFEIDQPGRLFSIRVGRSMTSAATHYLRNQREVDVLLSRLVQLRGEGGER